jgi:tetratricopeptide (TPR) repeat protein
MNRAERRRRRKPGAGTASTRLRRPATGPRSEPDQAALREAMAQALEHHRAGRLAEARVLFGKALAIDPMQPVALHRLGVIANLDGDNQAALRLIARAIAIRPDYANAHNSLGLVLDEIGQTAQAIASYGKAITIAPDRPSAHYNLAIALAGAGRIDDAIAAYERAIAIRPDYAEAHNNLTELLEKSNRTEELRRAVRRARQDCPGHPHFALRQAQLLRRDGERAKARAILEPEPPAGTDPRFMAARAFLLGELCDQLGDTGAAFRRFEEGNRLRGASPAAREVDPARALRRIDLLESCFTARWIAGWKPAPADDGRPDPVFLVGFPRSGTTLLDTILLSHECVAVVEEKPMVHALRTVLANLPGGDPDALARLDAAALARLRGAYFAELDRHLSPGERSRIIVDKLPLNIVEAGLIHRAFPEARFVFALRHPCDCVLSCFMRDFRLNDSMANFLSLEDGARFYDRVMGLWQHYREVLPLKVHTVGYESLVTAFEETLAPVLDFLGLGWDEAVRDHAQTALARGRISTPSYQQVTRPLYTEASGRWRRYGDHLEPVLAILMPWAKRFGYDR